MLFHVARFLRPTFFALIVFALIIGLVNAMWLARSNQLTVDAPGDSSNELNDLDLSQIVLPSAELTPDEVVRFQIDGLSDARADGVGILQCYAFASPANRAVTGPLDRFGKMVRQGPFQCMARPRAMLIGRPQFSARTARVLVTLIDGQDRIHVFTFVLSRQSHGHFENCWMTEAVLPSLPQALLERPRNTPAA